MNQPVVIIIDITRLISQDYITNRVLKLQLILYNIIKYSLMNIPNGPSADTKI